VENSVIQNTKNNINST